MSDGAREHTTLSTPKREDQREEKKSREKRGGGGLRRERERGVKVEGRRKTRGQEAARPDALHPPYLDSLTDRPTATRRTEMFISMNQHKFRLELTKKIL